MSSYTAHNSKVFGNGVKQYTERVIKAKLVAMLKTVAQAIVGIIDGNFTMPDGSEQFPVYTANLHDATGVGVYSDGAVQYFLPTKRATDAQHDSSYNFFYGSDLLRQAISNGATQFATGTWIVLFSTVPYAYSINAYGSSKGRGVGFFESLKNTLLKDVLSNLKPTTL